LSKYFYDEARGELRAVDDINFECRPGEIFGLLGANGAGKTTTLRILATILKPTGGSATLMGHDVLKEPEAVRQNLGFNSATTALYPRLTARETIEFFARVNGCADGSVRERVESLIARFGIGSYADARVDKLSQGMKQKVSIARTVVHDPPVLIFDEPTVGLDVLNALEMQKLISEFRAEGKTIIFSTHIMSEAEKLCDRIAIMHRGKILAEGGLDELRDRHEERDLEELFFQLILRHDEREEPQADGADRAFGSLGQAT
jgi:sodium transport system ATP-binding protein